MEQAVMGVLRATRDLRQQLSATTMEQAGDLGQVTKAGQELVSTIRNLALANDIDRLQESSDRFHEYIEHILEVSSARRGVHVYLTFFHACFKSDIESKIIWNLFSRNITDYYCKFFSNAYDTASNGFWNVNIDLLDASDCHS